MEGAYKILKANDVHEGISRIIDIVSSAIK